MPEIEIRSGSLHEIESLTTLEHGYYSDYAWQMNLERSFEKAQINFQRVRLPRRIFVPYPRNREDIFSDLDRVEQFLVARHKQLPVGYVKVMAEKEARVARVSDLVVSAANRRQGIASGLLLAVMDIVIKHDFRLLVLEMQSKNDPAITMASKLGFNFCGYRDHYFPNQELALFYSRFVR